MDVRKLIDIMGGHGEAEKPDPAFLDVAALRYSPDAGGVYSESAG